MERGDIPFKYVGRHRRIKAEDVSKYQSIRDEKRRQALEELAEMDAGLI
ncbi:hypothetical protein [Granulibacter bethesdensis]|nr:hypothetical protein [Granulibacter bethesdensis]